MVKTIQDLYDHTRIASIGQDLGKLCVMCCKNYLVQRCKSLSVSLDRFPRKLALWQGMEHISQISCIPSTECASIFFHGMKFLLLVDHVPLVYQEVLDSCFLFAHLQVWKQTSMLASLKTFHWPMLPYYKQATSGISWYSVRHLATQQACLPPTTRHALHVNLCSDSVNCARKGLL